MKTITYEDFVRTSNLRPVTQAAYVYLVNLGSEIVDAKQKDLASAINMTTNTFSKCITELIAAGYLSKIQRGRNLCNLLILNYAITFNSALGMQTIVAAKDAPSNHAQPTSQNVKTGTPIDRLDFNNNISITNKPLEEKEEKKKDKESRSRNPEIAESELSNLLKLFSSVEDKFIRDCLVSYFKPPIAYHLDGRRIEPGELLEIFQDMYPELLSIVGYMTKRYYKYQAGVTKPETYFKTIFLRELINQRVIKLANMQNQDNSLHPLNDNIKQEETNEDLLRKKINKSLQRGNVQIFGLQSIQLMDNEKAVLRFKSASKRNGFLKNCKLSCMPCGDNDVEMEMRSLYDIQ